MGRPKSTRVERTCIQCGAPFLMLLSRLTAVPNEGKYCSRRCYGDASRKGETRICIGCGESFDVRRASDPNVYCSRLCANGHNHKIREPIERFMQRVQKTDTCWIWTGAKTAGGYGTFVVSTGNATTAHRFAYEHFNGPIPDGMEIDHVWDRGCRRLDCVNPDHLEPVTSSENKLRSWHARSSA